MPVLRRAAAVFTTAVAAVAGATAVPAATASAQPAPALVTAAAHPAPYTSPNPQSRVHLSSPSQGSCSSGYLCAFVTDGGNGWYEFKFLHCSPTYHLYYWYGIDGADSFVYDDQTGGAVTKYLGSNGQTLQTMKPKAGVTQSVLPGRGGWNPVYAIDVC